MDWEQSAGHWWDRRGSVLRGFCGSLNVPLSACRVYNRGFMANEHGQARSHMHANINHAPTVNKNIQHRVSASGSACERLALFHGLRPKFKLILLRQNHWYIYSPRSGEIGMEMKDGRGGSLPSLFEHIFHDRSRAAFRKVKENHKTIKNKVYVSRWREMWSAQSNRSTWGVI